MAWIVAFTLITLFWLRPAIGFWRRPKLRLASEDEFVAHYPALSVMIPFRNEADTIEETIERLRQQDYPDLEIILIDDNSTDNSGEIARRAIGNDPRFALYRAPAPPPDWLGKCSALAFAAEKARGEYFLFTDAGAYFSPRAFRLAIATALREGLDHLVLFPRFTYQTWLERATLATFSVFFLVGQRAWKAHVPRSGARVGLGAFNLIRRAVYNEIGGYPTLRLEVIDDVGLGHLVSEYGRPQGYTFAEADFRCTWAVGVLGIVRVLEKNAFPSLDYNYAAVPFFTLIVLSLCWLPFLGFFFVTGLIAQLLVALSLGTLFALHRLAAPNHPAWTFLFFPFGATVVELAVIRSAYLCFKRGGIVWRDRFYPTRLLREGSVFRKRPLSSR